MISAIKAALPIILTILCIAQVTASFLPNYFSSRAQVPQYQSPSNSYGTHSQVPQYQPGSSYFAVHARVPQYQSVNNVWSQPRSMYAPGMRLDMNTVARPESGALFAWVESRQATGQCLYGLYCRAMMLLEIFPTSSKISIGYFIYSLGDPKPVDGGTKAFISHTSKELAVKFANGLLVDYSQYDICGLTAEKIADAIIAGGAEVVADCDITGSPGCKYLRNVISC